MYRIVGYDGCPFCQKAKALLTKEGLPFTFIDLGDDREVRSRWLDACGFTGDKRTFPKVYKQNGTTYDTNPPSYGEDLIGGYEDLENHLIFG